MATIAKNIALDLKIYLQKAGSRSLEGAFSLGYKSENGIQNVVRMGLGPGQSFTYNSAHDGNKPSVLFIRAVDGVLIGQMETHPTIVSAANYVAAAGQEGIHVRPGNPDNYSDGPNQTLSFEIDKIFMWTGIFKSITLTNPISLANPVDILVLEG